MRTFDRSSLLPYSAEELYAVVSDVEAYPQFLNGCHSAHVERRERVGEEEVVQAALGFKVTGVSGTFRTLNHCLAGRQIRIRLLDGPFRSLRGHWDFQPLGEKACKARLYLELDFGSRLLDLSLAPFVERAGGHFMDAFRRRVEQIHGRR